MQSQKHQERSRIDCLCAGGETCIKKPSMHLAVPHDPTLVTTHPSPNPSPSNPSIPTLVTSPPTITYCTVPNQTLDIVNQGCSSDGEEHEHKCEAGKLCTHTIVDSESPRAAPMPTIVVESQPDNMADARIVILGANKVGKSGKYNYDVFYMPVIFHVKIM